MKNSNNLIILGCANEMVCQSRIATLPEILKNFSHKTEILLSGGDPLGTGQSEAEKMQEFIENLKIPYDFSLHLEDKSVNTGTNIRNSLDMMLEKNFHENETFIITNAFHIGRTNRIVEHILRTEFWGRIDDSRIQTLATEDFFDEKNREKFLNNPLWEPTIAEFEIGENRGKLARTEKLVGNPTFEQERNKLITIMHRQKIRNT